MIPHCRPAKSHSLSRHNTARGGAVRSVLHHWPISYRSLPIVPSSPSHPSAVCREALLPSFRGRSHSRWVSDSYPRSPWSSSFGLVLEHLLLVRKLDYARRYVRGSKSGSVADPLPPSRRDFAPAQHLDGGDR